MANPARILNLEDSPDDSELAQRELRRSGLEAVWLRVDGEAAFREALADFRPDLVLADRNLPGFDGLAGLEIARQFAPDTPFVFLSGTMGEETAIECLKSGATDYVLKSRMGRLAPAVRRALDEAAERRALRESRLREELVLGSLPIAFFRAYEADLRPVWLNRHAERLTGFPAERLIEEQGLWAERLHPADRERLCELTAKTPGDASFLVEIRWKRADGAWRWFNIAARRIVAAARDEEFVGVWMDVTEQHDASEAQHHAEERFRHVFEQAPLGIVISDEDSVPIVSNPAFLRMMGFPPDRQDLPSIPSMSHPDDRGIAKQLRDDLVARRTDIARYEKRYVRVDGGIVWARVTLSMLREDDEQPIRFLGFAEDISEVRKLAEEVRQSVKMEAMGRLAGGVAHDFNNVLTVILGWTEMALDREDLDARFKEMLTPVKLAGERARVLTGQLLAFSRKQVSNPVVLDLRHSLEEIRKLLLRLLPENIVTTMSLPEAPLTVRVDPGHIDQILMNLAVNARDAMPNGGSLRLALEPASVSAPIAGSHEQIAPGRYVLLSMTDTGTGISESIMPRIFEPFFTTKGAGQGTGLGLATVYGIVKQGGGYIDVSSTVGAGTTFHVWFPRAEPAPAEEPAAPPVRARTGSGRILVIEDDAGIRGLVLQVLRQQGFEVTQAHNAKTGLATALADGGFDLVLSDVVLPDGDGRHIIDEVRKRCPRSRALLMSGHLDFDIEPSGGSGIADVPVIPKPFTPAALLQAIRDRLAK